MELSEVLLKRRSIRKFTSEKITEDEIRQLLDAAMSGPSACNKMPWKFYVVTNDSKLEALRLSSPFTKKIKAPLAIVVCGDLSKSLPMKLSDYWIQDTSAATENILLRVTDMNLGACWCGAYPQSGVERNIRKALGLSKDEIPLNIIFIGHPLESPEPRTQYDEKNVVIIK